MKGWIFYPTSVPHDLPPCLQDAFIKELTVLKERPKEKELKTAAGWYSRKDMVDDLNWDEPRPQHMIFDGSKSSPKFCTMLSVFLGDNLCG